MLNSNSQENLRVAVSGASGYGGAELARLLAAHPRAELVIATASGERAGSKISDLFPGLRGVCDVVCEELDADEIANRADFAFIALGHGRAMSIVPQLLERGTKVCDLGGDFRLKDASVYEEWYKTPHTAHRVLERAVYGLPEWKRDKIQGAQLVANPGCYPTSAILALAPFLVANEVEPDSVIVDSASGTSGAGRSSFGLTMHHPEVDGDFKAYKVTSHQHTPEIEQLLTMLSSEGHAVQLTFTAHLLPIARGILTTCYADLREPLTSEDAHRVLDLAYADEPFVRVHDLGAMPQIKHVAGSNFCDIGVSVDSRTNRLIVMSAIDNLIKGAAGQAIQNMNLMNDFDESEGLMLAPLSP
jgi:N-acetyl-gamma-glutamyl-phosphate reductase